MHRMTNVKRDYVAQRFVERRRDVHNEGRAPLLRASLIVGLGLTARQYTRSCPCGATLKARLRPDFKIKPNSGRTGESRSSTEFVSPIGPTAQLVKATPFIGNTEFLGCVLNCHRGMPFC